MPNGNMIFIFVMNKSPNLDDEITIVLSSLKFLPKPHLSILYFRPRYNYNREQLHLNDYMLRSQKGHTGHHQQQYQNRRFLQETEKKTQQGRINNFDFTDYDRSSSYNRNALNRDLITQTAPRPKRGDNNPYQIDERTFHRRRNFTNSQFQQHEDVSKFNKNPSNRIDQRQQSKENHQLYENKNNLPPRLRINNNNYRNSTQKQEYQGKFITHFL